MGKFLQWTGLTKENQAQGVNKNRYALKYTNIKVNKNMLRQQTEQN